MATAANTELVERFEQFFRDYYRAEIGDLARKFPAEQRSLYVDWQDLYRFDPDLADDYLSQPEQLREHAEEALRVYDLPVDVKLGGAHVRVHNLPESTGIRAIRSQHVNTLIQVRGLVRKATDVRPKIQEAAFECQRCGTLTRVSQPGGDFQEPHECQGCERQGPYRLNVDQSEFVDSQQIRVQESPEGLRGGETPRSIDVRIKDDLTGEVSPGENVTVTGVLRLDQSGDQENSPVFDVFMDGVAVEIEEEQFEDMEITEDDKQRIIKLSDSDDIYDRMIGSIAPSIYGYDQQKLAIALQLFSGVTKNLPDGTRIRGDLHMLLIGDPGTGKCLKGDTKVALADGSERRIRDLVETNLDDPIPIDDGVYDTVDFDVPTMGADGSMRQGRATKVWKREAPETMYRIRTERGKEIEVTPSHPLFARSEDGFAAVKADDLSEGRFIATPNELPTRSRDELHVDYRRSRANNAVSLDLPETWTPSLARLVGYIVAEGHVQKRSDNTGCLWITNDDREVLDDITKTLEDLGLNPSERETAGATSAREIHCSSIEFVTFLEALEPAILTGSESQRVPDALMRASSEIKSAFLKAYVEGEGHVSTKEREITVASMSPELLRDIESMLLSLGITSSNRQRQNGSYRVRISGEDFIKYVDEIGFVTSRKSEAAAAFEEVPRNTNTDIVPDVSDQLRSVRTTLGLSQDECGIPRGTYRHYEAGDRNPSRESLQAVLEAFDDRLSKLRELRRRVENGDWTAIEETRRTLGVSQRDLGQEIGVTQSAVGQYSRGEAVPDGGRIEAAKNALIIRIDDALGVTHDVNVLREQCECAISWERIESIEAVDPDYEWVYDLEVEGTHNYISNNVVSHNSQLLQYVQKIAPRSVYTSGKGASTAGLCVTGDTLVHTAEGFRPIGSIAREDHPDPVDVNTPAERAVGLYTYDEPTGAITRRASSHVWRMPEKPCRRIETARGKQLEASVNTPVLTCGPAGIEWTRISEIDPGDYVAVPKYGDVERSTPPIEEYVEFTTEKVKLADRSIEFLREELCERFGTLRDAAATLGLSEDFVYDSLRNRYVPLDKLDRILDAVDADRKDVAVGRAMVRHGDDVRIPATFDRDLLYLVGLVFGDGDIRLSPRGGNRGLVRISNGNERVLERAASIVEEKFDKSVAIERQDDRVPCIRIHSATIARLFHNLGMRTPKTDLALDPRLTTAEHADAFLRGLMDADGSVSRRTDGGSSVQLSTVSETLARQVQAMLETYGVHAKRRERERSGVNELADGRTVESKHTQYHLEIYGRDIETYADAIGFGTTEKRAALERIVDDASRRDERVPVGDLLASAAASSSTHYSYLGQGSHPGRDRARTILDDVDLGPVESPVAEAVEADLRWDEVVATEDAGEREVYDLTVPETHNFLAEGIVTHNTAAAVRDDFGEGQQWTLEAGALVLADQGIAAVDELDKMKCVTGDAMVQAADGLVRIRELARRAADSGTIEELPNGRTIRDVDTEVWTMADDGRIVRRPVTAIHEYDAPDRLREVTLESGESVTATADHPFFVFEDGERVEKSAADLDAGDWVYVPRSIPALAADGGAKAVDGDSHGTDRNRDVELRRVERVTATDPAHEHAKVYDLTVEGTHNFVANGMVVHNSEDRSAMHEALEQQSYHPDTEVLLADGHRVEIGEFVDGRMADDPDGVREGIDCEILPVEDVRVHSVDLEAGETTKLPVDRVSRHDAPEEFVRVEFSNGRSVLVTPEHPMFVDREGDVGTIPAEEIEEGAFVPAPRKLPNSSAPVELDDEPHRGKEKDVDLPDELTGDLAEALGLLVAEGHSYAGSAHEIGFSNQDRRLLARMDQLMETVFGVESTDTTNAAGTVTKRWVSTKLYRWFERNVPEVMHTARDKRIPARVLGASEEHVRRFLVGAFAGDGGVESEAMAFSTASEGLANDYADALAKIGVASRIHHSSAEDSWKTYVMGDSTEQFVEAVVDPADERHEKARAFVERSNETPRHHDVTCHQVHYAESGGYDQERREGLATRARTAVENTLTEAEERIDALADRCDLRYYRVTDVETVPNEGEYATDWVYDVTVKPTNTFVSQGVALHNSISISKAGINATLKSRCSLLGAANPKYGRFDQYEPIGEQIDLEPALISRFDLIFTVTDQPDEEKDRKLAEHILTTNYAGEINTQREEMHSPDVSREEVEEITEAVDPEIDPDLLRKYVAYAKQNCHPRMSEDARAAIRGFYTDLRAEGADEDAPVPVTARKLEALVRLAEASARIRLSDRVTEADADRVIRIVRSCLEDVGVDPESGDFDADVVETGTSKSQRERIKNVKQLIADIEDEYEEGAPLEVVLERAEEVGMEPSKAEHEIEKLKQKGEVYQPSKDHLRTT